MASALAERIKGRWLEKAIEAKEKAVVKTELTSYTVDDFDDSFDDEGYFREEEKLYEVAYGDFDNLPSREPTAPDWKGLDYDEIRRGRRKKRGVHDPKHKDVRRSRAR